MNATEQLLEFCRSHTTKRLSDRTRRKVSELLDDGADIDGKDDDGKTPLIHALWNSDEKLALCLLEFGADANVSNKRRQTPLMVAVTNGLSEGCNVLLNNNADIAARDEAGQTALMWAVDYSRGAFCERLSSPTVIDLRNQFGISALTRAVNDGNQEICRILLNLGASTSAEDWKLPMGVFDGIQDAIERLIAAGPTESDIFDAGQGLKDVVLFALSEVDRCERFFDAIHGQVDLCHKCWNSLPQTVKARLQDWDSSFWQFIEEEEDKAAKDRMRAAKAIALKYARPRDME